MHRLVRIIAFLISLFGALLCIVGIGAMAIAPEEHAGWKTTALCLVVALVGVLVTMAGFWIQRGLGYKVRVPGFEPIMPPPAANVLPPAANTAEENANGRRD